MKKIIAAFYIILFIFTHQVVFADVEKSFWNDYQDVLTNAVTINWFTAVDGRFSHASVNYKKIRNDTNALKDISYQKNKLEFANAPEGAEQRLAFWINAYNFFTIVEVIENYPVTSMKEIGWKKKHHNVGSNLYSLDDIEHKVLRHLKDPRIHFAINCASVGCPSLSPAIFTGIRINEQLDKVVINALKNPLHIRMVSDNKIHTTQIFKWFGKDFKTSQYEGIKGFIHKFAPEKYSNTGQIKTKIKYDWNLNTKQNIIKKMNELSKEFPRLELKIE